MIGQTLSHYRILKALGAGSTGRVYLAEDRRLGRQVALKIFTVDGAADEARRQRFEQEAQAASALSHPNILTVFDIGSFNFGDPSGERRDTVASDGYFIATEFVAGRTLRACQQTAAWQLEDAIEVVAQIAEGLAAAHRAGVIHCDIKPENLMRRDDGLVKILDFGIARLSASPNDARRRRASIRADGDSSAAVVTARHTAAVDNRSLAAGLITGTVGYLSPEQVRGDELDNRADVFSLGVVFYEMLAARPPFDADSAAGVCAAILNREPPPLSLYRDDPPLLLEAILRKMLEKDRDARYPAMAPLLADLRRLLASLDAAKPLVPPALPMPDALPTGAAFRGLLPFQEADRQRFYGREVETEALFAMVARGELRFHVLYGESGAGKTSLLRAALIPKCWEAGLAPLYCRSYNDPLATILAECHKRSRLAFREDGGADEDEAGGALRSRTLRILAYLRRVADALDAPLLIICDQFEEFFSNSRSPAERAAFIGFVAACHDATALPVRFLFSLRADFLYLINDEFAAHINEPLLSARLFHLRSLDERRAAEIIETSARQANLPLPAGLVKQVARDLAAGGAVLPSELQIVGEQLQNKRVFSLAAYRRAGGKEALVHSFLEDVIQTSGDSEGAHRLLRALISEENTRLTLTLAELAERLERPATAFEPSLRLLAQARLIRELQDQQPWRYELMHEYLIDHIRRASGSVMGATERANRLLGQYLSSYAVDRRTRIPLASLYLIKRHAEATRQHGARELLGRSLRWGACKLSALLVLLALATTLATAAFSVKESWEGERLIDGHRAAVARVVFSPDGRWLASCGGDGQLIVWDFARRERHFTYHAQSANVTSVDFSPDGRWLAASDEKHAVMVWETTRFAVIAELREPVNRLLALSFSPDGSYLIAGSLNPVNREEGKTMLWHTGSWMLAREIPLAPATTYYLFSPDSKALIWPGNLTMYELASGRLLAPPLDNALCGIRSAISPDGRTILSLQSIGGALFFQAGDWRRQFRPSLLKQQEAHRFFGRAVEFSGDGRLIATGAEDIVLWDAATHQIAARLEHSDNVWGLAFSPDGRWLVSSHGDGAILLWDVRQRRRVANFNGHSAEVRALALAPDGKRLASASHDFSVLVWNLETGQKEAALLGHRASVSSVAFAASGQGLASADMFGEVIVWDLASRQPRLRLRCNREEVMANLMIVLSPDERFLVSTWGGVYDLQSGAQVATLPVENHPNYPLTSLAFSPDSRLLVGVLWYGDVLLIDTRTWELRDTVKAPCKDVNRLALSADGKALAVGNADGLVTLLSTAPLRVTGHFQAHAAHVQALAFTPDGSELLTSGDDLTLRLWDVSRQRLKASIGQQTAAVLALAVLPDGRRLAAAGQERAIRIYTRRRSLWGYALN